MGQIDVETLMRDMLEISAAHPPEPLIGDDDGGLTADEWARELRISRDALYKRLHELKRAGLLIVGRRTIENLAGERRPIPVYRVKTDGR